VTLKGSGSLNKAGLKGNSSLQRKLEGEGNLDDGGLKGASTTQNELTGQSSTKIPATIKETDIADVFFDANTTTPDQYGAVQFTNNTPNTQRTLWDFGDGFTSTEQNPTHVFGGTAGTQYTVTLTVITQSGEVGIDSKTNLIQIQNNRFFFETITNPTLPFSLYKMHSNATKSLQIRENNNNNTLDLGFATNDFNSPLDEQAFSNFLSSNNATKAYVVKGYNQTNNQVAFEETDPDKQLELVKVNRSNITGFLIKPTPSKYEDKHYDLPSEIDAESNTPFHLMVSGLDRQYVDGQNNPNIFGTVWFKQIEYRGGNRGDGFRTAYNISLSPNRPSSASAPERTNTINAYCITKGSRITAYANGYKGEGARNGGGAAYEDRYTALLTPGDRGTCFDMVVCCLNNGDELDIRRFNQAVNNVHNVKFY